MTLAADTFQDVTLQCRDCHAHFVWTVPEQRFYAEKGLQHQPARCRDCRSVRKVKPAGEQQTSIGTVKWFDTSKGFGFILCANAERDVLVHYTQIIGKGHRSLLEGQTVSFNLHTTPRGPQATNVQVVEQEESQQ